MRYTCYRLKTPSESFVGKVLRSRKKWRVCYLGLCFRFIQRNSRKGSESSEVFLLSLGSVYEVLRISSRHALRAVLTFRKGDWRDGSSTYRFDAIIIMSRWGRGRSGSVAVPLDSALFRENSNCPSAARSAGTVGKWGITSFTSIRSAPYGKKIHIYDRF